MSRRSRSLSSRSRSRQRIATATWRAPSQGLMYGSLELDVTDAELWWSRQSGVGVMHTVGAAVARALAACPDANARVVFGRVRPRAAIDVSFAVSTDGGSHLMAVCVRNADAKSAPQIAGEMAAGLRKIARGEDAPFQRALRVADSIPGFLVRPGLWIVGFVTAGLGRSFPFLNVEAHPFGSALVTSVGQLGIEEGLAPVLPFARLGLVVSVGSVDWRPRVVEREVVARRTVRVGVTLDHRLLDGAQAAGFAEALAAAVERPWEVDGAPG